MRGADELRWPAQDGEIGQGVDLEKGKVVGSVDTLKDAHSNPNSLVLLPEWNHFAGH